MTTQREIELLNLRWCRRCVTWGDYSHHEHESMLAYRHHVYYPACGDIWRFGDKPVLVDSNVHHAELARRHMVVSYVDDFKVQVTFSNLFTILTHGRDAFSLFLVRNKPALVSTYETLPYGECDRQGWRLGARLTDIDASESAKFIQDFLDRTVRMFSTLNFCKSPLRRPRLAKLV